MAFAHDFQSYRHVFDSPLAKGRIAPRDGRAPSAQERLMECEFSERGRNPRFAPGWYILPGLVLGVAALALLL